MSAFDDLMNEGIDAGIQEDWINRVRAASDGSPLRQEIKTLKDERDGLREQVGKFRTGTLGSHLAALGFKGNPDALKVPDDLDPFDQEKVSEWAIGMNLVQPPEPSDAEREQAAEHAAHDRMAQAAAGASLPANANTQGREQLLAARTAEEFDRILQEQGGGHP